MKYEIRKDKRIYAAWNDAQFTPDKATLKGMANAGYILYVDGKKK